MSVHKNMRQEIKAETRKFKTLSFGEKITYIKDYYWIHIIAAIVIIIAAIGIYFTIQAKNFNTHLYVILANNVTSAWDDDGDTFETRLSNPYAAHVGIDNDKERIIIDNNYTINPDKDIELSYYSAQSLIAMYQSAKMDLMIGDNMAIEYFCEEEYTFFHPLTDIFDEEFLKKYKDNIIYHTYTNGTKVPVAFDVTDYPYIQNAALTTNPVLISVFDNSTRPDTAIDYIRHILESK